MAEAAFAQRRKKLRNSVASSLGADSGILDATLEAAGISGARRAETLSPQEYLRLGDAALRFGLL
ncbi:MAG TPA: ribosomal RNA small subunit methyltransferase A, partial [Desulfobacterales bacterium]|nr:ribosomal RNA small subunit methyltransferase A [Desulfobacterales bacterium]